MGGDVTFIEVHVFMVSDFKEADVRLTKFRVFSCLIGLVFLISAFFVVLFGPVLGGCGLQKKYISDEEFIETVKKAVKVKMEMVVWRAGEREGGRTTIKQSIYSDWDFDPDDPDCCRLTRSSRSRLVSALIGQGGVVVEVNPKKNKPFVSGMDGNYRFFFDGCGFLKSSDMGLPDTHQRIIRAGK